MHLRRITEEERAEWTREIAQSAYGLLAAAEFLRRAKWVLEARQEKVNQALAMYVSHDKPSAYEYAKLGRALERAAQIANNLTYVIVPCAQKRLWPPANEDVSAENINGAFTYKNGTQVFVFRCEEYPKVMLHEALHHSRLDPGPGLLLGVEQLLRARFHVAPDTTLLVNEGIVEAFATWHQVAFLAQEMGMNVNKLWECECAHARALALELLARTNERAWSESTNAFSYIVVRALVMPRLSELRALIDSGAPLLKFFEYALAHTDFHSMHRLKNKTKLSMRLTVFGDF